MKILSSADHHPGRFGLGEKQNVKALSAVARMGLEAEVDLFIANGDVLEEFLVQHKPGAIAPEVYRRQCSIVGDAFRLFCRESGKPVVVLHGNHDLTLSEELLHTRLNPDDHGDLSFDLRKELIFQPHPDVVITHGHIFHNTLHARHAVEELLEQRYAPAEALAQLNANPLLEEEAAADAAAFDRKFVHRAAMTARRIGLLQAIEGWITPRTFGLVKSAEQSMHASFPGWSFMRSLSKRFSGMTDSVAHLVQLLGAKVGIVGHDHQHALAQRSVFDPRSGNVEKVTIANSGDWIGHMRPKAAVLVDTEKHTASIKHHRSGNMIDLFAPVQYGNSCPTIQPSPPGLRPAGQ